MKFLAGLHILCITISISFSTKQNEDFASTGTVQVGQVKTLKEAVFEAKILLRQKMAEIGGPCLQAAVSLDGKLVFSFAIGLADVENSVGCNEDTVIRVGSISKSLTTTAVAKLWQEGKIDMDKPIYDYIPNFPQKCWEGKKVNITTRQLVTNSAGIRHYQRKMINESESTEGWDPECIEELRIAKSKPQTNDQYIKQPYKSVTEALNIFKYDLLLNKPGTKFYYTSPGFIVASAVIEAVSGQDFLTFTRNMWKDIGLKQTYWDVNEDIIPNRSKSYNRTANHILVHAPYIDKSWKWASSSVISTCKDLVHFGNVMLYCFQQSTTSSSKKNKERCERRECFPSYLTREIVRQMWSPLSFNGVESGYGMGWGVNSEGNKCDYCSEARFFVSHSGTSFGTRTRLMVLPRKNSNEILKNKRMKAPLGTVVSVMTTIETPDLNLLKSIAFNLAVLFDSVPPHN